MDHDVQVFGRIGHHVEIVLVVAEAFDDAVPVGDFQFDGDVG
jgi:hypothetical protein